MGEWASVFDAPYKARQEVEMERRFKPPVPQLEVCGVAGRGLVLTAACMCKALTRLRAKSAHRKSDIVSEVSEAEEPSSVRACACERERECEREKDRKRERDRER